MVLLLVFGLQRRRRIQRANQAYITNANNVQAYPVADTYGNSYNSAQGYDPTFVNSQVPQYPPPTHPQSHPGQPGLYPGYDAQAYAPVGAPLIDQGLKLTLGATSLLAAAWCTHSATVLLLRTTRGQAMRTDELGHSSLLVFRLRTSLSY